MGSPWKHRLISKDPDTMTGVCSSCGPVALRKQTSRGTTSLLCKPAYSEHMNGSKFRHVYRRGLTPQGFEEMCDAQGRACAICGDTPEMLHIDHDHSTGMIRALLCRSCNLGLGFFHDEPERLVRAIKYLQKWKRAASRRPLPSSTTPN